MPGLISDFLLSSYGPVSILWLAYFTILASYGARARMTENRARARALGIRERSDKIPKVVRVRRGDYKALTDGFFLGTVNFVEVDGPTGCGKSTHAIHALMAAKRSTFLIVCPTDANVANILHAFNVELPNFYWRRGYGNTSWTPIAFVDFTHRRDYDQILLVTSAERFADYVLNEGRYPPVDGIILDEYHLPTTWMVFCREFLLSTQFYGFVAFVSATPPGRPVPPPSLEDKTLRPIRMPDTHTEEFVTIADHRTYRNFSCGTVATIVPNCYEAHFLVTRLEARGANVMCLCSHSTVEEAREAFATSGHASFVLTPDVEAGVTLKMAVFVDTRTRSQLAFRDGVLYDEIADLDVSQGIQRLGRAGRIVPTVVYFDQDKTGNAGTTDMSLTYANVAIYLMATGLQFNWLTFASVVATRFSRIRHMTRAAILRAAKSRTPIMCAYEADNSGTIYAEYGGTATTFVEDNLKDFRQFRWSDGYAYSPYLDLTRMHDLSAACTPAVATSIAEAIVAADPNLSVGLDLMSAIVAVEAEPKVYAAEIYGALKRLFQGVSNCWQHYDTEDEAKSATGTWDYPSTVGDRVEPLVEAFISVGGRYTCDVELVAPGDFPSFQVSKVGSHKTKWTRYANRKFWWDGDSFVVSTTGKVKDRKPDLAVIEPEMLQSLRPLLAAALTAKDKSRCTNLAAFKDQCRNSPNSWARSVSS